MRAATCWARTTAGSCLSSTTDGLVAEVRAVSRDQYSITGHGSGEDIRVAGTTHPLVSHMYRIVPRCVQGIADPRGQVLVEQESHAGGRSG